jgi:hypothetical protein
MFRGEAALALLCCPLVWAHTIEAEVREAKLVPGDRVDRDGCVALRNTIP